MRLLPLLFLLLSPSWAGEYLGARQCGSCHPLQHMRWLKGPHAQASQHLAPNERREPRCTSCHTSSAPEGLHGVQCESCHGPGRYTWRPYIKQDRPLARALGFRRGDEPGLCQRCHTQDSPKAARFKLQEAMKQIACRVQRSKPQIKKELSDDPSPPNPP